jgi:hypothetical protein
MGCSARHYRIQSGTTNCIQDAPSDKGQGADVRRSGRTNLFTKAVVIPSGFQVPTWCTPPTAANGPLSMALSSTPAGSSSMRADALAHRRRLSAPDSAPACPPSPRIEGQAVAATICRDPPSTPASLDRAARVVVRFLPVNLVHAAERGQIPWHAHRCLRWSRSPFKHDEPNALDGSRDGQATTRFGAPEGGKHMEGH